MELLKCLFGVVIVVVLACDVAASQWAPPQSKPWSPSAAQQQPKVPLTLPLDECEVEGDAKISCGPSDITPEQCQNINCCFDGQRCYYRSAVTVQCTKDGQFVVVAYRDATRPRIDVESVNLLESNDPSCSPAGLTRAFVIFQFSVTACGTTVSEEAGYVVYENHLSSSYEVGVGPRGSITRDSHFELLFQCKYSATAVEAVVVDVNNLAPPVPVQGIGPLRVELRLGSGQCQTKGCVEANVAYNSYYTPDDYPITKALREPVYVEVRIVGRSDPNIILTLEHCWATANPNPHSLPQWDILLNGCPFADDRHQTEVVPVDASSGLLYPTHYKRFIMKMLTFVDQTNYTPQQDMVFIHCATAVCHPNSMYSCERHCHRQPRAVAAGRRISSKRGMLVSSGKVILVANVKKNDAPRFQSGR